MAWVRIDDQFPEHPKVAAAGPLAMAMQVAALCYSNRKLTDGFVPRGIARTLLDFEVEDAEGRIYTIGVACRMSGEDVSAQWVIDLLVDSGMWEPVPGGYSIHDYHDFQPSKAEVEAERDAARQRMRELRANRKGRSGHVQPNNKGSSSTPVPVPEVPSEPEKIGSRKRATQLPDGWKPNDKHRALADEKGLDLNGEAEQFCDHHTAKGSTFKDWDAAFRTWLRNSVKFGNSGQPSSYVAGVAD